MKTSQRNGKTRRPSIRLLILVSVVALVTAGAPAQAGKMDTGIEDSARQSYVFTNQLRDDEVKVKSKDGAVTLTGTVQDDYHKSLAGDLVMSLPDVKSVDNQLKVKGPAATANSDAWIGAKIKTTLLFHRSVNARATEVDVKDGVVTLRGKAANQAQKELTTEYAMDVEGVKDVDNEMEIVSPPGTPSTMGEKIDDASITAQVKMTLLLHRSTSALHTSVVTSKGIVTLTGKAANRAEIDLATKIAGDVTGVEKINNLMKVE